jgi:hypothetical protein
MTMSYMKMKVHLKSLLLDLRSRSLKIDSKDMVVRILKNFSRPRIIGASIAMVAITAYAADALMRDPFSPYLSSGAGGPIDPADENNISVPPLQRHTLGSYRLVGVIASKEGSLALMRTPDGLEYFVREGDLVGATKHTLTQIDGVSLKFVGKNNDIQVMRVRGQVAIDEN